MSPEVMNAIIAVGSAVASAVAVWVKMRRGGGTAPTVPTPANPTPEIPSTGRPGLDLLIKLWLARQAAKEQQQHEADAKAFLAEIAQPK